MKLKINKNCLSYGRRIYRAGESVEINDTGLARRLAAASNGDFEITGGDEDKALPPIDLTIVQPKRKRKK